MKKIVLTVIFAASSSLMASPAWSLPCGEEISQISHMLGIEVPGSGTPQATYQQPETGTQTAQVGAAAEASGAAVPAAPSTPEAMTTAAPNPEALTGLQSAQKLYAAGDEAGCMAEITKVKSLLGV